MDRFLINFKNDKYAHITDKNEIAHITKILRMKKNDKLEIMDGQGFVGVGKIIDIEKSSIKIEIEFENDEKMELDTKIVVYQGIPKLQKMDFIIQKLTEIGVSEIVPVDFERCVKKIKNKEEKQIERWQKIAEEATKQCKRRFIPLVKNSMNINEVASSMMDNEITFVCYENEKNLNIKKYISELNKKIKNKIGIIIGPEGGITEEEYSIMINNGAKSVSLGNTILRTETASIFASSIIAYELE